MSGWTQADIDERNRKQAAQGSVADTYSEAAYQHVVGPIRAQREGRVKGIAAEAERTCNGRVYHSKAEAVKALELYLAQKAGAFRRVTPQVPYPIVVNGVKICNVVVDFEIDHNDGTIEALEVKGHETDLYKLKAKLLRACYPKLRYTVVQV